MASSSRQSAFQRSLEQYLARQDIEDFETTTLKDLKRDISKLQPTQPQDLKRLKYFLEGIEQYGKVVKRYDSNTDLVAFIWVSIPQSKPFNARAHFSTGTRQVLATGMVCF